MSVNMTALPRALREAGVRVIETDGWLARGYDTLTPVGQMNHHTAIPGPISASTAQAMIRGRSDLPGPLCNAHGGLDADGGFVLYLIAGRRARHAGPGSAAVLDRVKRDLAPQGDAAALNLPDDSSAGNRSFFGWEWQHPGDASQWDPALLGGIARCNAALARLAGWSPNRSINHREWTRRKIDMSWRGNLRALVRDRMEDDDVDKDTLFGWLDEWANSRATATGSQGFADSVDDDRAKINAVASALNGLTREMAEVKALLSGATGDASGAYTLNVSGGTVTLERKAQ